MTVPFMACEAVSWSASSRRPRMKILETLLASRALVMIRPRPWFLLAYVYIVCIFGGVMISFLPLPPPVITTTRSLTENRFDAWRWAMAISLVM